jgi:hypothetical protein
MNPHIPKWVPTLGLESQWSPNGFLNFHRATVRVKIHRIEKFFISLEKSWNVDV